MHQIRLKWIGTVGNKRVLWTPAALYKAETTSIWRYLEGEKKADLKSGEPKRWSLIQKWQDLSSWVGLLWTRDSHTPSFLPFIKLECQQKLPCFWLTLHAGCVGADNYCVSSSLCCLEWYSGNYWGASLHINLNGWQLLGQTSGDLWRPEGCILYVRRCKLIHPGGEMVTVFQNDGTTSPSMCPCTVTSLRP